MTGPPPKNGDGSPWLDEPNANQPDTRSNSTTKKELWGAPRILRAIARAQIADVEEVDDAGEVTRTTRTSIKAFLYGLAAYVDWHTHECYVATDTAALAAGLGKRVMPKVIRATQTIGAVTLVRQSKGGQTHVYRINVPALEGMNSAPGAQSPPPFNPAPGAESPRTPCAVSLHRVRQNPAPGADKHILTHPSTHPPIKDSAAARPARVSTKAADGGGVHAEWATLFCDGWKKRHGAKYPFAKGKDGTALAQLREKLEENTKHFRDVLDRYFADADEFVAVKARHGLALLNSQLHKYIVPPEGEEPRQRMTEARAADLLRLPEHPYHQAQREKANARASREYPEGDMRIPLAR